MRKFYVLLLFLFIASTCIKAQSPTCTNATPFCTGVNYTFPASTNATGNYPSNIYFDCLWTQPNPAFFYLEISNPGNITINIQGLGAGGGTNDIDFICWGPFTNPATMCNQLTATNVEDCSYSPTWNETCQINGASTGDYYVLLITNYSNAACNIDFSQTAGNATTNCCILGGDAGVDNSISRCETDPAFNMISQLGGTPDPGGVWYNSSYTNVSATFNPSTSLSGTYSYIVPGSSPSCPDDTALLSIIVNTSPIITLSQFSNLCDNENAITLSSGIPVGGTYAVNGNNTTIFTPSPSNVGVNTITYSYTDLNGCFGSTTQNITIYESPIATATTSNASCNGVADGNAILTINGGTPTYSINWFGINPLALTAGTYGYTITDQNNCTFSDSLIIYEPTAISSSINTVNLNCNGDNTGSAAIQLQGSSIPTGTVSTLNYCTSMPGSNMTTTIDNIQLIGDSFNITNNTTGICDQYEDYSQFQYADITQGQPYTIDITLGDCSPNSYPSGAKVYIDWNIDGDFVDMGEHVGTVANGPPGTVSSIGFTVPFNGVGATRMRIVSQFLNNLPVDSIGPCDVGVFLAPNYTQPWFGATEDYSIVIHSPGINATYIWSNGATTDSIWGLSAGNYTVDITDNFGCVITDSITIYEPSAITVNTTSTNISCYGVNDGGASITINGGIPNYTINVLNFSQTLLAGLNTYTTPLLLGPGTFYYSIIDLNNCILNDSITISSPSQIATTTNIINCDNYLWNGLSYNSTGLFTDTLTANNGCDSIATINLTINSSSNSSETRTECDSYLWNGQTYNASGSYTYTTPNTLGCDSIATLNITINYSTSIVNSIISCDDYTWGINNQSYTNSGIYTVNSTNNNNCPHTDSLVLTINLSNASNDTISSCNSYLWNGVNYITSGIYNSTLTNASGCDSIANLILTITDTTGFKINTTVCDSFVWPVASQTYSSSGIYTFLTTNINGCPNIDTLDLVIMPNTSSLNSFNDCDSYLWNGNLYTTSGVYSDTLTNSNGCDSIATLNLTINNSNGGVDTQIHCNSYTWIDGITYTASNNNATITYINTAGCDSIVTLDLIINNSNSGSDIISACDFYDWNGQIINTSGMYTQTLINQFGCDSIASLYLTISDTTTSFAIINACNNYTWLINNINYTNSGVYTSISSSSAGCVHIDSLILAVNHSNGSYTNITECDSYLWNNQLLTSTGIYDSLFTNSNGCDSLATLDLIINNSSSFNFSITACNEYTWNAATYQVTGTYTQTFQNSSGCDSTVTLNLTLTSGSSIELTTTIAVNHINCFNLNNGNIQLFPDGGSPPYSYIWNNGQTSSYINNLDTGLYSFTILDALGCSVDSSVMITQPEEIQTILSLTDDTICRYESTEIIIDIINASTKLYTIVIQDSIQKSYVIDSLGLLFPEHIPISLTPNYNSNITLISIIDENGCSNTTINTTPIVVNQLPNLTLHLTNICSGTPSFNFPIDSINEGKPLGGSYFIDNINTSFFDVANLSNGSYNIKYNYTDSTTLCFNTIEKDINIHPSPLAYFEFSPQPADMNDPDIYFRNQSSEISSSVWDLGDGTTVYDSLDFWHTYADTGKYVITYIVNNLYQCTDTFIDSLKINPIYKMYIPTAFTPNGDDINDIFKPNVIGQNNYIITIFNTWGEEIFKAENEGWDGRKNGDYVQNGVYSYSIIIRDYKNKIFNYTGAIQLFR